jgi:hypothetical protein
MKKQLLLVPALILVAGFGFASGPAAGPVNMISTEVMAPAAGRGPGAAASFWTTDLWIRCPQGGDVSLEFHALDSPSSSPTATAVVHMTEPVAYIADVLKTAFNLESGFGNIRIRGVNPVAATIRLYSSGGGGSYGFGFMAMPSTMSMGAMSSMMGGDDDAYRYYVNGLLPQPQARVNAMVMNTGAAPISGTVEVLDADGGAPTTGVKTLPFAIQPYSGHQFNDVLNGVQSRFAGGMGLQLRIRLDNLSSGMMMALATVTDNVTNDGYVIMGSMMDTSSGSMMGR